MTYVLALIAALLAVFIVALVIGVLTNLFSLIPRAGIRKWIVICITPFVAFPIVCPIVCAIIFRSDLSPIFRPLTDIYRALSSTTILHAVPAVVALISLIGFSISAFLPVKGEPYLPRGARWNLVWLLKWIGLLVVAFVLVAVVQDFELRGRLNRLEARADQLTAELQPPAVPDVDNAAIHYQRIVKLLEASEFQEDAVKRISGLFEQGGPFDEEANKYFQEFEPILAEFEAAAKCKTCRFPDATVPKFFLDAAEPRIHESSALKRLYQYGVFQICQQRPSEAIKCIRLLQAWPKHLQADPRNVDAMQYRHASRLTLELVQSLAADDPSVPAEELRSIFADQLPLDQIHRAAVEWERASSFKTLALTFDGRLYQSPMLRDAKFMGTDTLGGKATRFFMRFLFARDDLAAIQVQFAPADTPYDRTTWKFAGSDYRLKPRGQVARLLSSIGIRRQFFEMAESERRLSNIAIAAKLYRQDHGAWPSELSMLAPKYLPEVPLDPDTDTPFAFKAIENGLVVWANQSTEELAKAESEGKFWEATTHTYAPILFLGDALRLTRTAAVPAPADEATPE
jgi:hypothetical protein